MSDDSARAMPRVRFGGFTGAWMERSLGAVFAYQRPDRFIVKSTEYSKEYRIPVLTANKAFILGYTNESNTFNEPCVVFDDFTLEAKFVDFPFMVKSSAIKLLTIRETQLDHLYFAFLALTTARIEIMGHARHYITVVQPTLVRTPRIAEQVKIGHYFRDLDRLISLHQRKHDNLLTLKKAMLQKMFPQPGATAPEIRFYGFSGHWQATEFKQIVARRTEASSEDQLPRIEYEDIISGAGRLNKDIFKKSSRKVGIRFECTDVLYGKLRPYLKNWWLAEFDGIAVGDFWVLKSAAATSDFVYFLIQTEGFEKIANQSAGSKMPRSDWKLVSNCVFQIPVQTEEQQKIGTYFRTLDALITKHATQLQKLRELKSACLQKMFV